MSSRLQDLWFRGTKSWGRRLPYPKVGGRAAPTAPPPGNRVPAVKLHKPLFTCYSTDSELMEVGISGQDSPSRSIFPKTLRGIVSTICGVFTRADWADSWHHTAARPCTAFGCGASFSDFFLDWCIFRCVIAVSYACLPTPRWGGGESLQPLPDFLDSSKTAADIDGKLAMPYPASIWCLLLKYQNNPSTNVWENGVLMTSCSPFLVKKRQMFEGFYNVPFWCKTQSENAKCCKIERSTKWLPQFFLFWLWKFKSKFSKNVFKFQSFELIKNGIYVYCEPTYKQHTCEISKQYIYFWLCNCQKQVPKGDDVTF